MAEQSKYGHTVESWDKAKAELRDILISFAKLVKTTYYDDLIYRLSPVITFQKDDGGFFAMLAEISTAENEAGRGMLSVVAVNKDNGKPADNFYALAKELGKDYKDREEFYINEFKYVCDYWSNVKV